jgi:hypothetical protein
MNNRIHGARRKDNHLLSSSFLIGLSSVSSSSSELIISSSPNSEVSKMAVKERNLPGDRFQIILNRYN